ncbi:hypothetical protein BKA65DRAFT_530498 [Rhexocercosporidium sp. MPI-PUGE-AT-0058]|nr:hypothetical protein BKA65DRAFT_530498 [Rhexocercosporidium sp. MPI-PUGE-AT-0058]
MFPKPLSFSGGFPLSLVHYPDSLILYDISSPFQPRSYAPNPSKARLVLSFKGTSFQATGFNFPATRKFDDGADFYTLAMLQGNYSGKVVGDSFDIGTYRQLSRGYIPGLGSCLSHPIPLGTGLDYGSPHKDTAFIASLTSNDGSRNEVYARFNMHVDATFTAYVVLVADFLLFNIDTTGAVRALFLKRAHLSSWGGLSVKGDKREKLMVAFKSSLTSLARPFGIHDGPYLEGNQANYADLIVEWSDFRGWHGGVFARLQDALQKITLYIRGYTVIGNKLSEDEAEININRSRSRENGWRP